MNKNQPFLASLPGCSVLRSLSIGFKELLEKKKVPMLGA